MMKKLMIRIVIGLCFIPLFSIWSFLFSLYVFYLLIMFVLKGRLVENKIGYLILIDGAFMLLDWGMDVMIEKGVMKE